MIFRPKKIDYARTLGVSGVCTLHPQTHVDKLLTGKYPEARVLLDLSGAIGLPCQRLVEGMRLV